MIRDVITGRRMQVSAIFTSRPRVALAHAHARTMIAMNCVCCSEGRNPSVLSPPAALDGHVLPLDLSGLAQPPEEGPRLLGVKADSSQALPPAAPALRAATPLNHRAPRWTRVAAQSCLPSSSLPQPQVTEQGPRGEIPTIFLAAGEANGLHQHGLHCVDCGERCCNLSRMEWIAQWIPLADQSLHVAEGDVRARNRPVGFDPLARHWGTFFR